MIQVCSACGTRWNVRDRRRVWCPRCHGTLLAPSAPAPGAEWSARPTAPPLGPAGSARRLQAWEHAGPVADRISLDRGATGCGPAAASSQAAPRPHPPLRRHPAVGSGRPFRGARAAGGRRARSGPSLAGVRATLIATMVVLGVAALVHVVRYALLIVNRSVLLNKVVAFAATWLGVLVSVIALFMVVASAVVLTNWLIARRAAAFAHHRREDPRPVWALRAGCLVPLVNLAWAPVFVIELADVEERLTWLRRPIVVWWIVWMLQHRGVGVLDRDELHPGSAGHRRQHRDHDRRLPARAGGAAAGLEGVPWLRASGRSSGRPSAG